jgi:hypothetical protein
MFKLDIGILLPVLVLMVATVPVTALFCHFRSAGNRQISIGTVLLGAGLTPVAALFATDVFHDGWKAFSLAYWTADDGIAVLPILWVCATVLCSLPALAACWT